eukprot:1486843-Prorocentrum_lima.AAC.1
MVCWCTLVYSKPLPRSWAHIMMENRSPSSGSYVLSNSERIQTIIGTGGMDWMALGKRCRTGGVTCIK